MLRKLTFGLLVCCLLAAGSSGCGNYNSVGEKSIRYAVGAEPQTLDPRRATGSVETNILAQIFEGLTTLDAKANPMPAAAESWEISPDGLTYIFHLRRDAKWSNGDPLTAADFEFAWKSALDPGLASEYAYQLYYLKNGEAFNKAQASADQVGVRALNDNTLEVTLEKPTAYFLSLTAFTTYYPVHRPTVQANPDWAVKVPTLIGNGPYKITEWVHNSRIEFAPNDFYWDAAAVKSPKLSFILTESAATDLAMFASGQIDSSENVPTAEIPRLVAENSLRFYPYLATYFYCFNVKKPPLDNPLVRRALTLAIDRRSLVSNITRGGQQPALAWVPAGLPDAEPGQDFRVVGGELFPDNDVATARELLVEAGYPNGNSLPEITLIYNTSEGHKAIAEAVQEMWKKNLGVEVKLANQEWKVFIDSRHKGDFQIARHGWTGDYADPMTFLDMFTTDSGNNDAQYSNEKYDELVALAKSAIDPRRRWQALHEAEQCLVADAVIAPLYFYTNPVLSRANLKGIERSITGVIYFKKAYLE